MIHEVYFLGFLRSCQHVYNWNVFLMIVLSLQVWFCWMLVVCLASSICCSFLMWTLAILLRDSEVSYGCLMLWIWYERYNLPCVLTELTVWYLTENFRRCSIAVNTAWNDLQRSWAPDPDSSRRTSHFVQVHNEGHDHGASSWEPYPAVRWWWKILQNSSSFTWLITSWRYLLMMWSWYNKWFSEIGPHSSSKQPTS